MNALIRTLFASLLLISASSVFAHPENLPSVLKKATPAVVNISVSATRTMQRNPFFDDPFFRRFFNVPEQGPQRQQRTQSVGSGVIIDARRGHVITNHHVVNGADEIIVTLQDRRRFEAELIGSDSATDIAVLRIDAKNLSALEPGDSRALQVGDFVAAIGNPFGLGQTVTTGIVSALGRSGLIPEGYEDFIQTDASINPGNSGGALIDSYGRLVGINTAIITPAGGNVGIGFAVPMEMVAGVLEQLLEFGEVQRGQLGVLIQDVTPDLALALGLPAAEGALVSQVIEDSAAATAGIEVGDVIVSIDGEPIIDSSDLRNQVGLMRIGERIRIEVIREGERLSFTSRIGEASVERISGEQADERLDGAEFRNIESDHSLYGQVQGVEIFRVEPGSRAWRTGLRQGDIVLSVNRRPVASVDEFTDLVDEIDGALALHIQRGGARLFVVVQ